MSDTNTDSQSHKPLFQGMDEKERVYAPEEVPGTARPAADEDPDRADRGGFTEGVVIPPPAGNAPGSGGMAGPQGGFPFVPVRDEADTGDDDPAARRDAGM